MSPTVGETFGSWPSSRWRWAASAASRRALVAGLLIGLIEALSAFWFGPIYKDMVVYGLFVARALAAAAGTDGQSVMTV